MSPNNPTDLSAEEREGLNDAEHKALWRAANLPSQWTRSRRAEGLWEAARDFYRAALAHRDREAEPSEAEVEAVARAIAESDIDPEAEPEERWEAFKDDSPEHEEYRKNARAAIAAMQEAPVVAPHNQGGEGDGTDD